MLRRARRMFLPILLVGGVLLCAFPLQANELGSLSPESRFQERKENMVVHAAAVVLSPDKKARILYLLDILEQSASEKDWQQKAGLVLHELISPSDVASQSMFDTILSFVDGFSEKDQEKVFPYVVWTSLQSNPKLKLRDDRAGVLARFARNGRRPKDVLFDLVSQMRSSGPANMRQAIGATLFKFLQQEGDVPPEATLTEISFLAQGGTKIITKMLYKIRDAGDGESRMYGMNLNLFNPGVEEGSPKEALNLKEIQRKITLINQTYGTTFNAVNPGQREFFAIEISNCLKSQKNITKIIDLLQAEIDRLQEIDDRTPLQEREFQDKCEDLETRKLCLVAVLGKKIDEKAFSKEYYVSSYFVGETLMTQLKKAYQNSHGMEQPTREKINQFANENPSLVYKVIMKLFNAYWAFIKGTNMTVLPGDIHPDNVMELSVRDALGRSMLILFDFGVVGFPEPEDKIDYAKDPAGALHKILKLVLENQIRRGSAPQSTNMDFAFHSSQSASLFYMLFKTSESGKLLASGIGMDAFLESIRESFEEEVCRGLYNILNKEEPSAGSEMGILRDNLAVYYERPFLDFGTELEFNPKETEPAKRFVTMVAAANFSIGFMSENTLWAQLFLKEALLQRERVLEDLIALAMEDEKIKGEELEKIMAWKDSGMHTFIVQGVPALLEKLSRPAGKEGVWSLATFVESLDHLGQRERVEKPELLKGAPAQKKALSFKLTPLRKKALKDLFVITRRLRSRDPLHPGEHLLQEYFDPKGFVRARELGVEFNPKLEGLLSDLAQESKAVRFAVRMRRVKRDALVLTRQLSRQPASMAAFVRNILTTEMLPPLDSFSHYTGLPAGPGKPQAGEELLKHAIPMDQRRFEKFQDMLRDQEQDFLKAIQKEASQDRFLLANQELLKDAMVLAREHFNKNISERGILIPTSQQPGLDVHVVFVPLRQIEQQSGVVANSFKTKVGDKPYIFMAEELLEESPNVFLQEFIHEFLEGQIASMKISDVKFFSHTLLRGYEALFNEDPGQRMLGKISDTIRMDMRRGGIAYAALLAGRTDFVLNSEIPQKIRLHDITPNQGAGNGWVRLLAQDVDKEAKKYMAVSRLELPILAVDTDVADQHQMENAL